MEKEMKNTVEESVDWISDLPDAILQYILSKLTFKTAVRTSILSSKWRDHWTLIPKLDFDDTIWASIPSKYSKDDIRAPPKRDEFAGIVDRFLRGYKGRKIQRFCLYFPPVEGYHSQIMEWLKVAKAKGVKEVDLDFKMEPATRFDLPSFIMECESISVMKLKYCNLKLPLGFRALHSLKNLYLREVDITDDMVEILLLERSLLESLSLIKCNQLVQLKVTSPGPHFKTLAVVDNENLNSFEINAPNLQTLQFSGQAIDFFFKNISGLQDALLYMAGGQLDDESEDAPFDPKVLMSCFSHVEILSVSASLIEALWTVSLFSLPFATRFYNLKELHVPLDVMSDLDLATLTCFLGVCPYLEKLFIEVGAHNVGSEYTDEIRLPRDWYRYSFKLFNCRLYHLKTVKITGFVGQTILMKLVKYLMANAVALRSLILVACWDYEDDMIIDNVLWDLELRPVPAGKPLMYIGRVLSLHYRNSSGPKIQVVRYSEDCDSENPTYTEDYRFNHLNKSR
ncbi:putative FBD-associated F-box protein At1g61330 [Magnolia sinica]|uniref:putative FBD-associated F-box protein At1g61330 n=1 Tax=Magnolia sinica TaxID=86752 RepID=UPI00265B3C3A|nr:putative FBD-associated F-box protein At1g61330 [Magnolia sinica]